MPRKIDPAVVEARVRDLLEELLGRSMDWPKDFEDTPRRVASWLAERFTEPVQVRLTSFDDPDYQDLVIVKDIPVSALCPHHLLNYVGKAHVAYLPNGRVLGLSKFPRLVRACANFPKTQESLTALLADTLWKAVEGPAKARGLLVTLRAQHLCLAFRGAETPGVETVTTALRGSIDKDEVLKTLSLHNGA